MALDMIHRARSKDCVVLSDSLFSLQAIESCKVKNPLILQILKDHNQLISPPKIYPPTSIVVGGGQQTSSQWPANPLMELTGLANRRLW